MMVAEGCTISPPTDFICVHCGWLVGGVRDPYFFKSLLAINMFEGVMILNNLEYYFSVSPPYFDLSDIN